MKLFIETQSIKKSPLDLEPLKQVKGVDFVEKHQFFKSYETKDRLGRPLPAYLISGNFNPSEIYEKITSQNHSIRTSGIVLDKSTIKEGPRLNEYMAGFERKDYKQILKNP